MISGFNTDVDYEGVTYHVQTEDKGAPSFLITSLVYNKGTILASKRTPYADDDSSEIVESELAEKLSRQHKLICAAVKTGRLSDLQKFNAKQPVAAAPPVDEEITPPPIPADTPEYAPQVNVSETNVVTGDTFSFEAPIDEAIPVEVFAEDTIFDDISIIELDENDLILSDEAIKIIEDPSFISTPIDATPIIDVASVETHQTVSAHSADDPPAFETTSEPINAVEDLIPEEFKDDHQEFDPSAVTELSGKERPQNQKLNLELIGDSNFRGGERKTITIMVTKGSDQKVVESAQIMVKVVGSSFRPVIFHARSDSNGLAKVHLQMPSFNAGRAALLVRAQNEGQEVEFRRIVSPN